MKKMGYEKAKVGIPELGSIQGFKGNNLLPTDGGDDDDKYQI